MITSSYLWDPTTEGVTLSLGIRPRADALVRNQLICYVHARSPLAQWK